MEQNNYCTNCKKTFCIDVYDEDYNKLDCEIVEWDGSYQAVNTHNLKLIVKTNKGIFTDDELRWLFSLLSEKLVYGGDSVYEMVGYADLYKKIEKYFKKE